MDATHFVNLGKSGHVDDIGLDGMIVVLVCRDIIETVEFLDHLGIRAHKDKLDAKFLARVLLRNLPNSPGYMLNDVGNVPVIPVTGNDEVEGLGIRIFLQSADAAILLIVAAQARDIAIMKIRRHVQIGAKRYHILI